MGKRSDFDRKDKDFYETPEAAMVSLLPHINHPWWVRFCDPCCGTGAIQKHIHKLLEGSLCVGLSNDLYADEHNAPDHVFDYDARSHNFYDCNFPFDVFITNPPWTRSILHPIIDNLASQKPTWLLIDSNWANTKQASPYLKYCKKIVVVGRVKWIAGSKHTGMEDCSWFLFDKNHTGPTEFYGR